MPPRKFKESDGIASWVNTSKTNKPRFKLQEHIVQKPNNHATGPQGSTSSIAPIVEEPIYSDNLHSIDEIGPSNFGEPGVHVPQRTKHVIALFLFHCQDILLKKYKTEQEYMETWRDKKRSKYLNRLLSLCTSTSPGQQVCTACKIGKSLWRCLDCMDTCMLCVLCFRHRHQHLPFHRVEKWNGRFFQRGSLWQVGVKIYLGHQGAVCPNSIDALSQRHNTKMNGSEDLRDNPIDFPLLYHQLQSLAHQFQLTPKELLGALDQATKSHNTLAKSQEIVDTIVSQFGRKLLQDLLKLQDEIQRIESEVEQMQSQANQESAQMESDNTTSIPMVDIPILDQINDEEWEDEDDGPIKGHIPRFVPRPPTTDGSGNPFVTVVHSNGFHSLPVVWCSCNPQDENDLQLLDSRLYPATYKKIKTVFTFECLDDFRMENLECKASHYQYHNKLRRLTCPEYVACTPNKYVELRRVSRQWRNLKYRKWFRHFGKNSPSRGEMSLFCAACPQPGINLPENWEQEYKSNPYVTLNFNFVMIIDMQFSYLYLRSFVADGNFKADHLKQKNEDIWLTNGEGFMTGEERYQKHLAEAKEVKTV
ncbi:MAG: hypothetical protein QOH50_5049 [Kribbellaceae bacterium]|nr:hypothetical protein [Kribbellaceae bacterium]